MMRATPSALRGFATAAAASQQAAGLKPGLVLGCGSNVMDLFFPTRKLPMPGEKQYFAAETCMTDAVVGGVTLNHLSWARALGAPTGLLALQGTDQNGETIRAKMKELGVSTEYVRVSKDYSTSVSHILLEPSGERTILMAPASTSRMTKDKCAQEFGQGVASRASLLTTEISQVPLSGVEYLLDTAAANGVPSLLDVDVTPSTATGPAQLGTLEQVRACVTKASCLKLTASAAQELLHLVAPGAKLESKLENVAQQLADAFGVRLCVVTDGSRGSALAVGRKSKGVTAAVAGGSKVEAVIVPIYKGVVQKDATGAGDAFFGGIIACTHAWGFPTTADGLVRMGSVAAASGAACVEVIGALPVPGVSSPRMQALCPDARDLVSRAAALDAGMAKDGSAGASATTTPASTTPSGLAPGAASDVFLDSLLSDSESLQACAETHTRGMARLEPGLGAALRCFQAAAAGTGKGHVYCTGMGKSGAVAARFAISLRSVSVRASFAHASEWVHGDLGTLQAGDTVVAFSHSGKTAELVDLAARLPARGVQLLSITNDGASPLAKASAAHFAAPVPSSKETGNTELLGTVPTRSVVAQESICNALLSVWVQSSGLTREVFKTNHPGGSIGAVLPVKA